jgi:hypothetical protein
MTVLGKTLVFFNLVFSILTGALVLMVFSARTNWQVAAKKLSDEIQIAQASVTAYQKEAADTRQAAQEEVAKVKAELDNTKGQLASALNHQKDNDDKYVKETIKVEKQEATIKSITTDRDRNAEEVKILAHQKDSMQKRIDDLVKLNSAAHDAKVAAEIDANSSRTRMKQLVENIKVLEKKNQELMTRISPASSSGTNVVAENPPPENVEGLIKKADATSGLVTLSIGSDSGLAKGHTLEVYRLEPSAKYLGKIRIMEVWPHAAVGKPIAKPLGAIQEGDHVASKILGGG